VHTPGPTGTRKTTRLLNLAIAEARRVPVEFGRDGVALLDGDVVLQPPGHSAARLGPTAVPVQAYRGCRGGVRSRRDDFFAGRCHRRIPGVGATTLNRTIYRGIRTGQHASIQFAYVLTG